MLCQEAWDLSSNVQEGIIQDFICNASYYIRLRFYDFKNAITYNWFYFNSRFVIFSNKKCYIQYNKAFFLVSIVHGILTSIMKLSTEN